MNAETFSPKAQLARRAQFHKATRTLLYELVDDDGKARIPQFQTPYREPVWCLSALYHGDKRAIDLANKMVARYHSDEPKTRPGLSTRRGQMFNIFQTNTFCDIYFDFQHLMTLEAKEVAYWHVKQACETYCGSAQPDFVFRGCNDNMPALATCGLLQAGQILNDENAIKHARWNLRQLRAQYTRNAWMGEFNSSTYSAVTLWAMAKIASVARDKEIRELALGVEHRLWAELLLHYHPGTMHQSGPMSRAYAIDYAGHNHSLQIMLWYAFGPEATGRDPISSYFSPDGREVIHFEGCYAQSIAEYCHFLNVELHVPQGLAHLITDRHYPAVLRGRSEGAQSYEMAAQIQTETYMEESFSLSSSNYPMFSGGQAASLYATYRRKPEMKSFRDAATIFFRYTAQETVAGLKSRSADGKFEGDKFIPNQSWCYTIQNRNTAMLLCTPNLLQAPYASSSLKMNVVFPAHFGSITSSIIGDGKEQKGAVGESQEVVPVSVLAGQVYVHIQPMLPTSLPRRAAVRLKRENDYEVLELVNYEGAPLNFTRRDLAHVLNGMVMTVADVGDYPSLAEFHRKMSDCRVVDYLFARMRYTEFHRDGSWFRVVMTADSPGIMTEVIDGLPRPSPIFESNQIEASTLPFLGERSEANFPFFPWGDMMEMMEFRNSWIIGSRGLPGEKPYSKRLASLKTEGDVNRGEIRFPTRAELEKERDDLAEKLKAAAAAPAK